MLGHHFLKFRSELAVFTLLPAFLSPLGHPVNLFLVIFHTLMRFEHQGTLGALPRLPVTLDPMFVKFEKVVK